MNTLAPDLKATGTNVKDLTDTVKRQPWRLIYPSTKKYPNDAAGAETITVRKTTKAGAAASPVPNRRNVIVP